MLVNCARLPAEPLALQSELLGHKKGAFTGAVADHVGRIAWADGGTLFLDEVESMPPLAQGFLLDLLDGTVVALPLGGGPKDALTPRFRLVCATKVPLGSSGLRRDLCERLAEGHLLELPRLEDHRDDIPGLVLGFADEQSRLLGRAVRVDDEALAAMSAASWPGHIRQLRAALVTVGAANAGAVVELAALPAPTAGALTGRVAVTVRGTDAGGDEVFRGALERPIGFRPPPPWWEDPWVLGPASAVVAGAVASAIVVGVVVAQPTETALAVEVR